MSILDRLVAGRWAFARLACIGALCSVLLAVLPACGGGGDPSSPGGGSTPPPGTTTGLSCDGYPRPSVVSVNGAQQTYTQVCLIVQEYAQVTPNLSASTNAGSLIAHGRQMLDTYVVYSRIVAQAADEGTATALAKSVVITTANSTVSASPDRVDSPQSLQIDFEIFTAPSTNLTLTTGAGDLTADDYNATLQFTSQAGNASLQNVQGQVTVDIGAGAIDAKLAGSGWTGTGMTASTQTGNISVSRSAAYQAAFTAQTGLGTASIDGKQATTTGPAPAVVTAGSGAPIMLKSMVGNVTVVATQ
jgi:hypothetical protein